MVKRTLTSPSLLLQLSEWLQHHIYLPSSLIFITRDTRSGKTTLTESLSNTLPTGLKKIYLSLSNIATVMVLRQKFIAQLSERVSTKHFLSYLDSHLIESLSHRTNRLELALPTLTPQESIAFLLAHNFQQIGSNDQ